MERESKFENVSITRSQAREMAKSDLEGFTISKIQVLEEYLVEQLEKLSKKTQQEFNNELQSVKPRQSGTSYELEGLMELGGKFGLLKDFNLEERALAQYCKLRKYEINE